LGYTVTDGDITGVTAGTGLSGGGNSGAVTVSLDTTSQYVVPSQSTHSGKYLTTNGTTSSWGTVDLSGKTDKNTLTTTGDIYYASSANTPARLGIGSTGQVLTVSGGLPTWSTTSSGAFRGVSAVRNYSLSLTVPTNTFTIMNWDIENFDTDNFHNNSTNITRFVVPLTGYYFINAYISFNFNFGNALGGYYVGFRKNGTGTIIERHQAKQNTGYSTGAGTSGGGALTGLHATFVQSLNANDYFEIGVWQDTNGSVGPNAGGHADNLVAYYLGA